jgi:YVTN family beta-propeller protein
MEATAAWDVSIGDPSVIVLVLDTGVQQDHPDINQVTGRDFTSDAPSNPNGGPFGQYDSHGTWVAGCISEKINNGIGSVGIAPGVKVASARCYNHTQADGSFTIQFSWVVDALNWGQLIGARVSNNSNGYGAPSGAIESAYASTRANGMVHFASAGNGAVDWISYPSTILSVNSVGAARGADQSSPFTQWGTGLKYMAPGEGIYTTDRTGAAGRSSGDYITVDGTSFASAYAAGVAALIISKNPNFSVAEVENQLQSSCNDMDPPTFDTGTGYGMIDAFRALTITPATPPNPFPPPRLSSVKLFYLGVQRLAADPRRPRVYATEPASNSIVVIDTTTLSITATVPVGPSPLGLAVSADGTKLWVANSGSTTNGITVIDLNNLTTVGSFSTPVAPSSIVEGRDNRLYVSAKQGWNGVMQFDGATGTYQGSIGSFYDNEFLATSPDRKKLYCAGSSSPASLTVFDISTASATYIQENDGSGAIDLKVSHDGNFLYGPGPSGAGNSYGYGTQLLSASDIHNILGVFDTGPYPGPVAFSNDGALLYQSRAFNGVEIKIFDTRSSAMLDDVRADRKLGYAPFRANDLVVDSSGAYLFAAMYVSPTTNELRIYATNRNDPLKLASQAMNVSTRLSVETGDNVGIGGFIITGNQSKQVLVRGIGPALSQFHIADVLADPIIELHDSTRAIIATNDNWKDTQQAAIQATGLAPQNDLESAILMTLSPGSYTVILRGTNQSSGVGLVEVYDLTPADGSKLYNISTRGRVQLGDNVMIGGFILGGGAGNTKVIVRAIGPSLAQYGLQALADPTLELHDGNGALIYQNDDWQSDQQQEITATGLAPPDTHESALVQTLQPGNYTAIVRGKNNTTGVALVEVYNLETN